MAKTPCFYVPKQLISPEYANFSVESKLLFGMILTNSQQTKSIQELAELIQTIDYKELKLMHSQLMKIEGGA